MKTHYPNYPAQVEQGGPGPVIGTECTGCKVVLTPENLSLFTDKVGVCNVCKPRGEVSVAAGMFHPGA